MSHPDSPTAPAGATTQADETEEHYSTARVAEIFAVSQETIRNWINNDKIKARRLPGGHFRIPRSAVIEYGKHTFGS